MDVIVAQSASIFELLASKDEALLIRRNPERDIGAEIPKQIALNSPFLVLDFGLNIVDCVRRLHLKGDRLSREGFDEDLHLEVTDSGEYKCRSTRILSTHREI